MLAHLTAAIAILLAPLAPNPSPPPPIGLPPGIAAEIVVHDIVAYTAASDLQVYLSDIGARVAYEAAERAQEQARQAAARAEAARRQPPPATVPQPAYQPAPVGGTCGGATNGADQFIQRESGGDPNAVNPSSGAYGCYQVMPGTWAGAGCNDLGQFGSASPAAQAACASRLGLSAWAL